jgi:pSer/pThr/pTyr-binding forkhead associated (FHA) protein
VLDLESTNGTFVNGSRVAGTQRLEAGDVLRVGETDLVVEED